MLVARSHRDALIVFRKDTVRDLEIWRQLQAGTIARRDARTIARWTLQRRGPYLGAIVPLVTHADPAMRAAALLALAGVRGVPGVRAIVAGLDDDDPLVRDAALPRAARHLARRAVSLRARDVSSERPRFAATRSRSPT